jgi:hypothetical protein
LVTAFGSEYHSRSNGSASEISSTPRSTFWVVDAYCGIGKRFIARADENWTAFLELEAAICLARGGRTTAGREQKAIQKPGIK